MTQKIRKRTSRVEQQINDEITYAVTNSMLSESRVRRVLTVSERRPAGSPTRRPIIFSSSCTFTGDKVCVRR